jgi:hypothetical protein
MSRATGDGAKLGKRCPNCLSEVRPQDIYCEVCGNRLEGQNELVILANMVQSLEKENRELRRKLWKLKRRPSRASGFGLSFAGFAALASSILYESNILAFIGLGLTFWGILLLYARPAHYVRGQILESEIRTHYLSLRRLLDHLGYEGQPVYLPPRRLEEMKGGSIFIGAERGKEMDDAPISDLSEMELFTLRPRGVQVVPPGLSLANLLEEEMGRNFSGMDLGYIFQNLPAVIIEGFELADGVEIEEDGDGVRVKIMNSIFEFLYREGMDDRLEGIGCPLVSSIALALTRSTGKPVTVSETKLDSESGTINVLYKMTGGSTA